MGTFLHNPTDVLTMTEGSFSLSADIRAEASRAPAETPHGNTLEAWCRANEVAREHVVGPSRTKWASGIRRRALAHVHERHPEVSLVELGRLFGGRDHSTVLYLLDQSARGKAGAALRQRTAKRVAAGKGHTGGKNLRRGTKGPKE